MNTAIIAEYNPFHKGHLYHINKTKEKTGDSNIIAIMSGNFTQRGEPAILDKVLRTKMALLNGVDMVLELPVEYATGSADVFAFGAIDIINKSNFIDTLSFGSESGDITAFSDLADVLNTEPEEFKTLFKNRSLCCRLLYQHLRRREQNADTRPSRRHNRESTNSFMQP